MSGPGGTGGTPGSGPAPRPEKKPPSERRPKDSEFFELPPDLKNLPQSGPPRHAVGTRPADRHPPSSKVIPPPVAEPLALGALVVGVVGAPLAVLWIAATILPAAALGLGFVAKARISRSDGQRTGAGLALAGIVLGALGCVGGLVGLLARG